MYVCVSGGKKFLFFGNFGVLCFLETPVLRFAILPYYRRYMIFFHVTVFWYTSYELKTVTVLFLKIHVWKYIDARKSFFILSPWKFSKFLIIYKLSNWQISLQKTFISAPILTIMTIWQNVVMHLTKYAAVLHIMQTNKRQRYLKRLWAMHDLFQFSTDQHSLFWPTDVLQTFFNENSCSFWFDRESWSHMSVHHPVALESVQYLFQNCSLQFFFQFLNTHSR